MAMDLIKENIECEQLLGENTADTIVKAEYVIPDTQPDVKEILMLDAKPSIIGKEVMQDKIHIEGQIAYNILYLAKVEDKSEVFNATYMGKFSNYVEIMGCQHKMYSEAECIIEHMNCMIVNERKIGIEGIIKLKAEAYKNYDFQIVKDISGLDDIQMLKNPVSVDKIIGTVSGDMIAKSHMQIPMDKPQIGSILKCDVDIHKKDVKLVEGKVKVEACALVNLLYKDKATRDLVYVSDDVVVSKEMDMEKVNPMMENYTDFSVNAVEYDTKEDDLGENRIIDIEALVNTNTKVMYKEQMDMIYDAYSPTIMFRVNKKDYELNVMHGQNTAEAIAKSDIEIGNNIPAATEIVMCTGMANITDKKIVEDKVIVDGVVNANVVYKTNDNDKYINTINEEIPFSCPVEIPGCKIDMQCIGKVALENISASIEAGNIAVKAVVEVYVRVNYITHKEFMVDMVPDEEEAPKKKASIIIYVVQQGDTLWKIAKKYCTTLDMLSKINELENPDLIKPGDKLIIPGRAVI